MGSGRILVGLRLRGLEREAVGRLERWWWWWWTWSLIVRDMAAIVGLLRGGEGVGAVTNYGDDLGRHSGRGRGAEGIVIR